MCPKVCLRISGARLSMAHGCFKTSISTALRCKAGRRFYEPLAEAGIPSRSRPRQPIAASTLSRISGLPVREAPFTRGWRLALPHRTHHGARHTAPCPLGLLPCQRGRERVERIWREEGLKVPQRQKKRGRLYLNDGSAIRLRPCWENHVWSYDFVAERLSNGKKIRNRNTALRLLQYLHDLRFTKASLFHRKISFS